MGGLMSETEKVSRICNHSVFKQRERKTALKQLAERQRELESSEPDLTLAAQQLKSLEHGFFSIFLFFILFG